jgi:hypothetical protein
VTGEGLSPIFNLASFPSPLTHSVGFTWSNPAFPGFDGVLVVFSTSPFGSSGPAVTAGQTYAPGEILSDNSVVRSTSVATAFDDTGLSLDVNYYYSFIAEGAGAAYSVSVSTTVFLDLPPMAPNALSLMPNFSDTSMRVIWSTVTSNLDGSPFHSSTAPASYELIGYDVYRATASPNPSFVLLGSTGASATYFDDNTFVATQTWVYKVVSRDEFTPIDAAMGRDTDGNLFVYSPGETTQLEVPPALVAQMRGATNGLGSDILIRESDLTDGSVAGTMRNAAFNAYKIPNDQPVPTFAFPKPVNVTLNYVTSAGEVAPTANGVTPAPASKPSGIPVADAASSLGLYWNNGANFLKFFGSVNTQQQTVSVQSADIGNYEIRAIARSQDLNFDISQLTNKVITPNGDGKNDQAMFILDNPRGSAVSGKIYDLRGAYISDMATCSNVINQLTCSSLQCSCLQWNGYGNNRVVPGGVYVYEIRGEDKVFTGTLLVIR